MVPVHIVISDRSWILERLASEIADRLDYVTYDTEPDLKAQIVYYMTYGCRRHRIAPVEAALFTHYEESASGACDAARESFWNAARDVDHCVCMCARYENMLREKEVPSVCTIPPGVDHDEMKVKVKIGVVGRTYHTGRKGEALVEQVMDIPEIEWHFTGSGWPGPARSIPPGKMGDFYHSMDYILVPALYEGGPMCVPEALACGRPVIAPPIGWVDMFPHIEYETGNADDLRRVLQAIVDERKSLAASTCNITWERWAQEHDALFRKLAEGLPPETHPGEMLFADRPAALLLDRRERASRGGPSQRIPLTVRGMNRIGVNCTMEDRHEIDPRKHALIHSFNIWPPETALQLLAKMRRCDVPVVFSPIYLDLSERETYMTRVPQLFEGKPTPRDIDFGFRTLRLQREAAVAAGRGHREMRPGYFEQVRQVVDAADHIVCLSEKEKGYLADMGAKPKAVSVVPNPVNTELFGHGDPDLFAKKYNIRDYILCVGRIEARKNQLTLLHALRDVDVPIVLVGHKSPETEYCEMVLSRLGKKDLYVDHVPGNTPLMASLFAGARVFVLASWSEGAPLSALEAGAAGCNCVLSNRSGEQEYFGNFAHYCDPCDPDSIREAVLEACENPFTEERKQALKDHIHENFNWDVHLQRTRAVYEETVARFAPSRERARKPAPTTTPKLFVDVSQSATHLRPPTGIARVELMFATKLKEQLGDQVQLVMYQRSHRVFLPLTLEQIRNGEYQIMGARDYELPFASGSKGFEGYLPQDLCGFTADSVFVAMGGMWILSREYTQDLAEVRRACRFTLVTAVYDVIRYKFPHLYPRRLSDEFVERCRALLSVSDRTMTDSECAKEDILDLCATHRVKPPEVCVFRIGDVLEEGKLLAESTIPELQEIVDGHQFVLCVSAIDVRKNHQLLYNLWQRLAKQYGERTPHLILVGGKSYHTDDLVAVMTSDAYVKDRFHMLTHVEDDGLDWLYRNCLFTMYPSIYEGYGMPVAESLTYGKVCIASDSSSIPEIAPDLTDLIDPYDFQAWYTAVITYAFDERTRRLREDEIRSRYVPTTWDQSVASCVPKFEERAEHIETVPEIPTGAIVCFGSEMPPNALSSRPFQASGWSHTEKAGNWTRCRKAALAAVLDAPPGEPLLMVAEVMRFNNPIHDTTEANITCNGRPAGHWSVRRTETRRAVLLANALDGRRDDDSSLIEFEFENVICPIDHDVSQEKRLLGLHFRRMVFSPVATYDLALGEWIDFGAMGQGPAHLQASGWTPPAPTGLTTTSHTGVLQFCLNEPLRDDMVCEFDLCACGVGKESGVAEVEVFANRHPLGVFFLHGASANQCRAVLPAEVAAGEDRLVFEFTTSDPVQVKRDNANPFDSGVRGVSLRRLALKPVADADIPAYTPGKDITFGVRGNSEAYQLAGWAAPLAKSTWTEGEQATLAFVLPASHKGNLALSLDASAFVNDLTPCLVTDVEVNGQAVGTITFADNQPQHETLALPASVLNGKPFTTIRFSLPGVRSAAELGCGHDERRLGLLIERLSLLPADG